MNMNNTTMNMNNTTMDEKQNNRINAKRKSPYVSKSSNEFTSKNKVFTKEITDNDFKNIISLNNFNIKKIKNSYDLCDFIIENKLINLNINLLSIKQGFNFEGDNGEYIKNDILYGLALEHKGLINRLDIQEKIENSFYTFGVSNSGYNISFRDVLKWLDTRYMINY